MILARQFVPMPRIRVESLIAAFPKLLDASTQHTFIETDDVRYVYQPLETLYLVLVTNKASNIMEDLETLQILSKLVPEYCSGTSEEAVLEHSFELIHAIDEILSLGHKEHVSLQQIRTFLEMDSHEEKLHQIIMESKMNEARDEARRKAEEIDKQKARMKDMLNKDSSGFGSDSMGSSSPPFSNPYTNSSSLSDTPSYANVHSTSSTTTTTRDAQPKTKRKPIKGMKIRKAQAADDFASAFAQEENLPAVVDEPVDVKHEYKAKAPEPHSAASGVDVSVAVKEYLQLVVDDDSEIKKFEVKGEVKLTVNNPLDNRCVLNLSCPNQLRSKTPSKVDQGRWADNNQIALSNDNSTWAVGASKAATIIRWRQTIDDPDLAPLLFTVWADEDGDGTVMTVEFQHQHPHLTMENVTVSIPCPNDPEVRDCTEGAEHDGDSLVWTIPLVEVNTTGNLEFFCPGVEAADLHPININFECNNSYSGIDVASVDAREDGDIPSFECVSSLVSTRYQIAAQ